MTTVQPDGTRRPEPASTASMEGKAATMYAHVIPIDAEHGDWTELRQAGYRLARHLERWPGYQSFILIGEPNTGHGLFLTLWETRPDIDLIEAEPAYQAIECGFATRRSVIPDGVYEVLDAGIHGGDDRGNERPRAASVTSGTIDRDKLDVAIRATRDKLLPCVESDDGSCGYLILLDRETNLYVELTVWVSMSDLLHGEDDLVFYRREMATGERIWESPVASRMFREVIIVSPAHEPATT